MGRRLEKPALRPEMLMACLAAVAEARFSAKERAAAWDRAATLPQIRPRRKLPPAMPTKLLGGGEEGARRGEGRRGEGKGGGRGEGAPAASGRDARGDVAHRATRVRQGGRSGAARRQASTHVRLMNEVSTATSVEAVVELILALALQL